MTSQFHEISHRICGGFLLFGTSQVGVTAIQVFSEHGLKEGQRVLVIGASGGVGHIATQASEQKKYRISSCSVRGNYFFSNLEIKRSQYIRPKVAVHKCMETIQGRKLFKGGNYMRKYGNCNNCLKRHNQTFLQDQQTLFNGHPLGVWEQIPYQNQDLT